MSDRNSGIGSLARANHVCINGSRLVGKVAVNRYFDIS
jgi:hypothetical protein